MRGEMRLGRIAGIRVSVHRSALGVLVLLAWSLATVIVPASAPDASGAIHWIAAVGGAVLFLVSLRAHALGHALVARPDGIAVGGVTLWLFSGVAMLAGEAARPGQTSVLQPWDRP